MEDRSIRDFMRVLIKQKKQIPDKIIGVSASLSISNKKYQLSINLILVINSTIFLTPIFSKIRALYVLTVES